MTDLATSLHKRFVREQRAKALKTLRSKNQTPKEHENAMKAFRSAESKLKRLDEGDGKKGKRKGKKRRGGK